MTQSTTKSADLYATAIQAGAISFALPWYQIAGTPMNLVSHRNYPGINAFLPRT